MTPSQQAKAAGLKSLAELSQISTIPVRTLNHWHEHKTVAFAVMLAGAVAIKEKARNEKIINASSC